MREVRHERAAGVVDLARPVAAGAVRQRPLDAALEVPRRTQAHAVGRESYLLSDGDQCLAGVAQRQGPGPSGNLGLDRAHADQPPGHLPILCAQRHRRLRSRQAVPPLNALPVDNIVAKARSVVMSTVV